MDNIKVNYSKMLEDKIMQLEKSGKKPRLLLHCCCAPCSSYVLEYLNNHFDITPYYYNPNISPEKEYTHRAEELKRLISEMPLDTVQNAVNEDYDNAVFEDAVKGLENEKEGGKRCFVCYRLRLEKSAQYAKNNGFDCFTTTLSISPLKNAQKLNEIGKELSQKYGINYLFSDFKKKEGYKRSIVLSEKYNLYRQNYCGCIYSYNGQKNKSN